MAAGGGACCRAAQHEAAVIVPDEPTSERILSSSFSAYRSGQKWMAMCFAKLPGISWGDSPLPPILNSVPTLPGAQLHERCPEQRSTHRNVYRRRLLTTQVGDLTLAIPKLRQGSFFPD